MSPPTPDPQLAEQVGKLRAEVMSLNRHMQRRVSQEVQTKVETEVAAKGISREEFARRVRASGKRTAAGLVLMLVLVAAAVGWNRITLQQAQRDLNNQVVRCFLRPGSNTPAQAKACADRFGGSYLETQQRSRDATANFVSLQEWARSQGWKPPERKP